MSRDSEVKTEKHLLNYHIFISDIIQEQHRWLIDWKRLCMAHLIDI